MRCVSLGVLRPAKCLLVVSFGFVYVWMMILCLEPFVVFGLLNYLNSVICSFGIASLGQLVHPGGWVCLRFSYG